MIIGLGGLILEVGFVLGRLRLFFVGLLGGKILFEGAKLGSLALGLGPLLHAFKM